MQVLFWNSFSLALIITFLQLEHVFNHDSQIENFIKQILLEEEDQLRAKLFADNIVSFQRRIFLPIKQILVRLSVTDHTEKTLLQKGKRLKSIFEIKIKVLVVDSLIEESEVDSRALLL